MNIRVALLVLTAGAFSAAPSFADPKGWTPAQIDIARLENRLDLRRLPKPLNQARRRYAGFYDRGRREIVGQYTWAARGSGRPVAGIEIVGESAGWIMDGGCSVFNVTYDVGTNAIIAATCGGEA